MNETKLLHQLFEKKHFTPNKNQLDAIIHGSGPLFLTAGPGSGKTRVLLWRVLVLIVIQKINPEEIFLATFTEKAARQLKQGLEELLSLASSLTGLTYDISQMYTGTLHSLCQRLLREDYFSSKKSSRTPFLLMDELDQFFFVSNSTNWKEILKAGGYSSEKDDDYYDFYKEINGWFQNNSSSKMNAVKNCISFFNRMSEEDFSDRDLSLKTASELERKLFSMTKKYRELLKQEKPEKLDFANLQQKTLSLILSSPSYKTRFKHVIVDEYQDTNTIQQKIYLSLASLTKNICVVGDDDQSLYRFRGANVENLIDFENTCRKELGEKPVRIDLNINYRSRKNIVDTYTSFIENFDWEDEDEPSKQFRIHDKNIKAFSTDTDCSVLKSTGPKDYVTGEVISYLKSLKRKGIITDWNQCAFLFPTLRGQNEGMSSAVKAYSDAFKEEGIPYYAPRAKNFLFTDECLVTFGLYAAVFDCVPDLQTTIGGMNKFHEWILEARTIARSILEEDSGLYGFIEAKIKEVDAVKKQYALLKEICLENNLNPENNADGSELKILLNDNSIKKLSALTIEKLSDLRLREYIIKRSEEKNPVSLSYVLSRASSLDWTLLDLFYELHGFSWYKDEFLMAEKGDDTGMYNLGKITQFLSKYMEMNGSVLSGRSFDQDSLIKSFFNSFLYTLFRRNENEYEDEETPFPSGAVPFLTVHQSKGLEFPVVVLGSTAHRHKEARSLEVLCRKMLEEKKRTDRLNEPLEKTDDFDTMRVFYVALSRAKNLLILSQFTGPGQNTYAPFKQLFAENDFPSPSESSDLIVPKAEETEAGQAQIYSFNKDYLPYKTCPRNYMAFSKYGFVPSRSQTHFYGSLVIKTIRDFIDFYKQDEK